MNKEEVISHLQEKLYGLPLALQQVVFESIYKIECGIDPSKVLDWHNRIETIYYEKLTATTPR